MSFNLEKKVVACLEETPEQRFTAREIANWIFETYPDECKKKQKRSTAVVTPLDTNPALIQQIVAEIGSHRKRIQKRHSNIKTTEGRPRKFYFTEKSDDAEVQVAEAEVKVVGDKPKLSEHDLYPLLAEYLFVDNQNNYAMRIDEKRSSNSRGPSGNRWLYPDMVALEDLSSDWVKEIKDCVQQTGDIKANLWAFEVKLLVNRSNVREVFYQTVSNSSWANYGYLVAGDIEGNETIRELRMLSSLHSIGVIHLNAENPAESQILIPSEERDIDWNMANRLAEENKDFREFLQLVTEFYQTGKTRKQLWKAA